MAGALPLLQTFRLERRDVDGLRALVARLGVVRHSRTLGKGAEAVAVDTAVVDEQVLAAFIRSDEAEALVVVEPLDGSFCHANSSTAFVNCVPRRCIESTVATAEHTAD